MLPLCFFTFLLLTALSGSTLVEASHVTIAANGHDDLTCLNGSTPCLSLEYVFQQNLSDVSIFINVTVLELSCVVRAAHYSMVSIAGLGLSHTAISCTSDIDSGLAFEHSQNIVLRDLTVRNCGILDYFDDEEEVPYHTGVIFKNCTNVRLERVSASENRGYGVTMDNTVGKVDIMESDFTSNYLPDSYSNSLSANSIRGGGGMIVLLSVCAPTASACSMVQDVPSTYTFKNVSFLHNHLSKPGPLFKGKTLTYGGGLSLFLRWGATQNSFELDSVTFINNTAFAGGGLFIGCRDSCTNNTIFLYDSHFLRNNNSMEGMGGGGVNIGMTYRKDQIPMGNNFSFKAVMFEENMGYAAGTNLFLGFCENCDAYNNFLTFSNCTWKGNHGNLGSAANLGPDIIYQTRSSFLVKPLFRNCNFIANQNTYQQIENFTFYRGEGVFTVTKLAVQFKGRTLFQGNVETALHLTSATVTFLEGSSTKFVGNTGKQGGAVALYGFSFIQYHNNTQFNFIDNIASFLGGALYQQTIDQQPSTVSSTCFLDLKNFKTFIDHPVNTNFYFQDNQALSGYGHSMYMSSINPCTSLCSRCNNREVTANETFSTSCGCIGTFSFQPKNHPYEIVTRGSTYQVNEHVPLLIVPGQLYSLPLEVYDDLQNDITPITVYNSDIPNDTATMDPAFKFVANNTVNIHGNSSASAVLDLVPYGSIGTFTQLPILLTVCQPGYVIYPSSENMASCVCSANLVKSYWYQSVIGCNTTAQRALIVPGYWIGYIPEEGELADENNLFVGDCPLGYCTYQTTTSSNNNGDRYFLLTPTASMTELSQLVCDENRTGQLCGSCAENHSVFYHSYGYSCQENKLCRFGAIFYIISELLPVLIIFFLLMILDVSLISGPAYSIVLMVQMMHTLQITIRGSVEPPNEILLDMAHLIYTTTNLDLFQLTALSFCIWDGAGTLDIFVMKYVTVTFAFGLVWITTLFLNKCNYARYCLYIRRTQIHHSIIQGLSAFFILCYSQSTQVTFDILNWDDLVGKGGKLFTSTLVFLNGDIEYFSLSHLKYSIPAVLFLLVIVIPLPVVLIADPFLIILEDRLTKANVLGRHQPWTRIRNKFKPLLDSFQACFKDRLRFFAGMYFFYRLIILISFVFSANTVQYYYILEGILIFITALHSIVQPFQEQMHNIIAILVFSNMALINLLTIRIYTLILLSGYESRELVTLQWLQMLLFYLPILYGVCWVIKTAFVMAKGKFFAGRTCLRKKREREAEEERVSYSDIDFDDDKRAGWYKSFAGETNMGPFLETV